MKTTIVIPNYNGKHFLKACLRALDEQTVSPARIIVVDNGSSDGSCEFLREQFPDVDLIETGDNLGFAAAVNAGIEASTTEYVLLLNNDTEADPDMIRRLEQAMNRHPRAFSAAAKMVQLHHPGLIDSAGDLYTVIGWGVNRGNGRSVKYYTRPSHIFTACAGAAIYRRDVFDKIGLFDEKHFAYLEDIDIGYRARLHGYANIYEPKALVRHVGSGTSGSKYNDFKVSLSARNSVWLNYKNMPDWQLVLNALPLALGTFVKTVFFVKKGFGKVYLKGLKEGFKRRRELTRVDFKACRFSTLILIQLDLMLGLLCYAFDWVRRKTS